MNEIEVSPGSVDPFSSATGPNKYQQIEFVNSKCMTCGAMGDWVYVERDKDGRITSYIEFDIDHYAATGGKKGKGHKEFHHFTLTRNHAEVFII